ncbi:hypothetical protein NHF50_06615 [Flavobacterium sp. NRK F10]|uniref:zincin-like metallopeptidase toxin domain-containing protein n=1 Tax=Flavobacterium sp. NRK F10 TaxID=2954931 RepID=UPI0020907D7F|nr:zincin-like metallopeptidase toxin domain-containing protein [Flavobacterium sp. NRK F10]MCO6174714.1 hypothetical protein [Flavobacterium sp. NRK F10]
MSDFKEIINYLKLYKESKPTENQEIVIVDFSYEENKEAHEEDIIIIKKKDLNSGSYTNLGGEIIAEEIYLLEDGGNLLYYVKKNFEEDNAVVPKYKRIPLKLTDTWETLEESTLVRKEISSFSGYYYSFDLKRVIFTNTLDEVVATNDVFIYHFDDINFTDGEEASFNYLDHEGYTENFGDQFLRALLDSSIELAENEQRRSVTINKKQKNGRVHSLPDISKLFGNYKLKYNYVEKGIRFNSFMAERAIKLEFNYFGSLLEFLNQTVFNDLDTLDAFTSGNRALFFQDYIRFVNQLLRKARGRQKLEVLYYIPVFVFKKINGNFLWNVLDEILDGLVTNIGLNVEDIVLHLLEGLSESYENKDDFFKALLKEYNNKDTRFYVLYDKLNGENFEKLVQLIQKVWFNSNYKNPELELYKNLDGPLIVNYQSDKALTFFYSNMNINWKNANLLEFEPDTSWWDEVASFLVPSLGEVVKEFTETEKSFYYHPFQPIAVFNFDKQKTGMELTSPLMPAFVLKAAEDKAFWENVITASEYVVDILTTFSGVGNLAKFRYLAKVAGKASKLRFVSKLGTAASYVKTGLRATVAAIEISSGTINALLKITNQRDEPWAKELSEVLLYLELLSLGGELGEVLLKRINKAAKNALKYEDDIIKAAKKEGLEAKQIDELIDEFKTFTGDNITGKGLYGGKILSKVDLDDWAKLLKEKFGTNLEKVDRFDNSNVLAQFDPNTNTIRYKDDVTEYFMAHESFHAEEMNKIGFDAYVKDAPLRNVDPKDYTKENWLRFYRREKYVYDKIIENLKKHSLNNEELAHNFFNLDYYILKLEKLNIKIPN